MPCAGAQPAETPLIKGQPAGVAHQRRLQQRRQQQEEEAEQARQQAAQPAHDQQPLLAVDARRWQGQQAALQGPFQQQVMAGTTQQDQQGPVWEQQQQRHAGVEAHAPQRPHHGRAPAADHLLQCAAGGNGAVQGQAGANGSGCANGQAHPPDDDSPNPFVNGRLGFTPAGPFGDQPADGAMAAAAAASDAVDSMPPVRVVHHHRTDSLTAVAPGSPTQSPFDMPQLPQPAAQVRVGQM